MACLADGPDPGVGDVDRTPAIGGVVFAEVGKAHGSTGPTEGPLLRTEGGPYAGQRQPSPAPEEDNPGRGPPARSSLKREDLGARCSEGKIPMGIRPTDPTLPFLEVRR